MYQSCPCVCRCACVCSTFLKFLFGRMGLITPTWWISLVSWQNSLWRPPRNTHAHTLWSMLGEEGRATKSEISAEGTNKFKKWTKKSCSPSCRGSQEQTVTVPSWALSEHRAQPTTLGPARFDLPLFASTGCFAASGLVLRIIFVCLFLEWTHR